MTKATIYNRLNQLLQKAKKMKSGNERNDLIKRINKNLSWIVSHKENENSTLLYKARQIEFENLSGRENVNANK